MQPLERHTDRHVAEWTCDHARARTHTHKVPPVRALDRDLSTREYAECARAGVPGRISQKSAHQYISWPNALYRRLLRICAWSATLLACIKHLGKRERGREGERWEGGRVPVSASWRHPMRALVLGTCIHVKASASVHIYTTHTHTQGVGWWTSGARCRV